MMVMEHRDFGLNRGSGCSWGLVALYQHLSPGDAAPPVQAAETFARFSSYPGRTIFIAGYDGQIEATCTLVVVPNLTRGGGVLWIARECRDGCAISRAGLGKSCWIWRARPLGQPIATQ